MRITGWRIARLQIPLRRPFRTALRSVDQIDDRVLLLDTDAGLNGVGSAAATPQITGATHVDTVAAWRRLAPALVGQSVADLPRLLQRQATESGASSNARAGIDVALHDLWGHWRGLPLHRCLVDEAGDRPVLQTDLTISVDTPARMAEACRSALDEGYRHLKIKLGREPETDLARLQAIHATVSGGAALRLDANQGWNEAQTMSLLRGLAAAGINAELLEQPLPATDLAGMGRIAAATEVPLLADESIHDEQDLPALLQHHAAGLINIKLQKSGGLAPALRLAQAARAAGLELLVGCMLESPIGVTAAAHLAWACGIERVDLDAPALAAAQPVRGTVCFDGPRIRVGDAPGLGIEAIEGLQWLSAGERE
ncbi:MAG: dipeptide epimerase [Lysobacterales bacterium]